jgi:WD40 repeat protein
VIPFFQWTVPLPQVPNGQRFLPPGLLNPQLPGLARAEPLPDIWRVPVDPAAVALKAPPGKVAIPVPGGQWPMRARSDDLAVYPTTPSPFVAVGQNRAAGDERRLWNMQTMKSTAVLSGKIPLDGPLALSADGKYLAGRVPGHLSVAVWSFASGRKVREIDGVDLLDFAGPHQLLTFDHHGRFLQVWDVSTGKALHRFTGPAWFFDRSTIALSPGRQYLALCAKDRLFVYDLGTGLAVGRKALPRPQPVGTQFCQGIAFSADGTELAAIFQVGGRSQLFIWDVGQGNVVGEHSFAVNFKTTMSHAHLYHGRPLEWLTDHSGWLVFGKAVIDRTTGEQIGDIPVAAGDVWPGPRQVLDQDRVLVVSVSRNWRTVESVSLPRNKPPQRDKPEI